MQQELASERPDLPISLLTINEDGYQSGLETMSGLGDLPVLQDGASSGVWDSWEATWRDVIIVDEEGIAVYNYNLTDNDLGDPINYEQLKSILIAVAEGAPPPPAED